MNAVRKLRTAEDNDFYVYVLFRETGVPFYVGKGRGRRWVAHEQEAQLRTSSRKCAIIRGMQIRGLDVIKVKLHEDLTETTAHEYEVALIKAVGRGRNGPLVNLTEGGDGASGNVLSAETRAKIAAFQRGKKKSPEAIEKMATARRGKKMSPEAVAKMAAAIRGRKLSPEHVAKLSAIHRGKALSQEHIAKIVAAKTGIKRSPETIAKMSLAAKGRIVSPETRAKLSAANGGKKRLPRTIETRAKLSVATRLYYERQRAMQGVA